MNRNNEMKAWDGVDPAHSSRKCATLAVGGDSETDLDATGGLDNSRRNLVTTPSLPFTDSRPHAFQSDRKSSAYARPRAGNSEKSVSCA
jgi:hypothetical protein